MPPRKPAATRPAAADKASFSVVGVAAVVLVLDLACRRADRQGEDDARRERHHGDDQRQRSGDPDAAQHQRADELTGGIERARSADDAAAVAIVDDAVQPDFRGRPQRRKTGAHDEARREPDDEMVGRQDRGEGNKRNGEHRRHHQPHAETGDQARQQGADDQDAGAGDRCVEADQPGRQAVLFQRQREERVAVAVEQGLRADQRQDAAHPPELHGSGLRSRTAALRTSSACLPARD